MEEDGDSADADGVGVDRLTVSPPADDATGGCAARASGITDAVEC